MDTRKMLLRLGVTAIGLIAALDLNIDSLFAQRVARVVGFAGGANTVPPGVTVRDRTEKAQAAADDERPASFRGLVRDAEGRPVAKATVWLVSCRSQRRDRTTFAPPVETLTDTVGRFSFGEVDEETFFVTDSNWGNAATTMAVARDIDGRLGWHEVERRFRVNRECEIHLRESIQLSGRVVDGQGKPLAGVRLTPQNLFARPPGEERLLRDHLMLFPALASEFSTLTAADGRFRLDVPHCDQVDCQLAARGVEKAIVRLKAGEPLRIITGEVVDDQGRPVSGAELRVDLPEGSPAAMAKPLEMQSDESGWFVLTRVVNDGTLKIWARAGQATSDGGQSFVMRALEGKLKIVVAEANACRLTGKVVDGEGHPVPTASVKVVWDCDSLAGSAKSQFSSRHQERRRFKGRSNTQVVLADNRPGDDGTFTTGPLWPEEHYHLRITADGHETVELPVILGGRGTNAQAAPIVLRRADRLLEGTVVDNAGQPLSDATVINSGDAETLLMARTDAAGRFRLDGLFEGQVYLLVRKDGYWPAGWRRSPEQTGQRIVLTSADQPRPVSPLPGADDRLREEREVVRRLVTELWQQRETMIALGRAAPGNMRALPVARPNAAPNAPVYHQLVALTATVAPDVAMQWSAAETNKFEGDVRRGLARRAGVNDSSAETSPGLLVAMAKRRSAAGLRDEAVRLLEDALRVAPLAEAAQPQSDLVWKAQIGTAAIAAGGEEWGRSLVREAADRVEELGGANATLQARGEVAIALAGYDVPRALRVWEMQPLPPPAQESVWARHYCLRLVVAIAYSDPQTALRLASQPLGTPYDEVLTQIACRVAERDTDQAIAIIEKRIAELPNDAPLFEAQALGRIAVAIAPRERSRAYDLIDCALGLCLPTDAPSTSRSMGNFAERAARIAIAAGELGHPDMRTVVDFVLASRLSPRELSRGRDRHEPIRVARLLALVDPATAHELLGRVPRPSDPLDTRDGDPRLAEWLQAWALIDLDRAETLFREILEEQDSQLTAKCIETSLLPMLELLTTPRAERVALVSRETVLP